MIPDGQKSNPVQDDQKIIHKADLLYDSFKFDELYTFLKDYADVDNDEILWRLARATMEKSKLTKEKAQRRQLIQEAFSTVERALALNDKNFACHKASLHTAASLVKPFSELNN